MSVNERWKIIWDMRNQGKTTKQIGRKLKIPQSRVTQLIHQSMHNRDTATWGEPNTPQRFYWLERFGNVSSD